MVPYAVGLIAGEPPKPPPDRTVTLTVSPGSRFGIGNSADFNVGNFAFNASAEGYGPNSFSYSISFVRGSSKTAISTTYIPAFGNRNAEGSVHGLAVKEDVNATWYVTANGPDGLGTSVTFDIGGYRQS